MEKRGIMILGMLFCLWCNIVSLGQDNIEGKNTKFCVDGLWYTTYEDGTASVVSPAISPYIRKHYEEKEYVIPETVEYDGKEYNVASIGMLAFSHSQAEKITLPSTMRHIGNGAFSMSHLKEIVIPEGLTGIENHAFKGTSLTEIHLPASLKLINNDRSVGSAFSTRTLKNIYVAEENKEYQDIDGVLCSKKDGRLLYLPGARIGTYQTPEGITTIAINSMETIQLDTLVLSEGVVCVEEGAFSSSTYSKLTALVIGSTVSKVGDLPVFRTRDTGEWDESTAIYCFATTPPSMKMGFCQCSTLYVPKDKKDLFSTAYSLSRTEIVEMSEGESIARMNLSSRGIRMGDFSNTYSINDPAVLMGNICYELRQGKSGKEAVVVNCTDVYPDISSPYSYFAYYREPQYDVPASIEVDGECIPVTELADYAFAIRINWAYITEPYNFSVTLPEGLRRIGDNAFDDNRLTSIEISESVEEIGSFTFRNNNLMTVTIPENVNTIGEKAFVGCRSLNSIYSLSATPPSCSESTFLLDPTEGTVPDVLYVPEGSMDAYKSAVGWSVFTDIREISASGIRSAETNKISEIDACYDLNGRRIKGVPQKGVYIQNGRKVVVK
jgi:hypothetical protein